MWVNSTLFVQVPSDSKNILVAVTALSYWLACNLPMSSLLRTYVQTDQINSEIAVVFRVQSGAKATIGIGATRLPRNQSHSSNP